MGSVGSTPPGLSTTGLDPAGGQVSLDEARQQGLLRTDADATLSEAAPATLQDPGERLLGLPAWTEAGGPRLLPRSDAFASPLARLDRGEAASTGVDGILSAL